MVNQICLHDFADDGIAKCPVQSDRVFFEKVRQATLLAVFVNQTLVLGLQAHADEAYDVLVNQVSQLQKPSLVRHNDSQ